MGLSKQDIRAIGNADTLVFFHNVPIASGGERLNWLKCIVDALHSPTGYEQMHVVHLEPTGIQCYGEDAHTKHVQELGDEKVAGSAYVGDPHLDQHRTWIKTLREGDELQVEMWLGNNNQYIRDAGLAHDYSWLSIRRPKTDAHTKYWLGNVICPALTYSVRMLRAI